MLKKNLKKKKNEKRKNEKKNNVEKRMKNCEKTKTTESCNLVTNELDNDRINVFSIESIPLGK